MNEWRAPACPGCGGPPAAGLAFGRQAFCGNDDCQVLTWDRADDPALFKAKSRPVTITRRAPDEDGGVSGQ